MQIEDVFPSGFTIVCVTSTPTLRASSPASSPFQSCSQPLSLGQHRNSFLATLSDLNAEVRDWVHSCSPRQRSPSPTVPSSFFPPDAQFGIVGPLPPGQEHHCLLTCIDRHTRWPEAMQIRSFLVHLGFALQLPIFPEVNNLRPASSMNCFVFSAPRDYVRQPTTHNPTASLSIFPLT